MVARVTSRPSGLLPHLELIRDLYTRCQGNRVRVHEMLRDAGVETAYATLTEFCREQGVGVRPKQVVGTYNFQPGEEMQHDTSPHRVKLAERLTLLQCASLVLWASRMQFSQCYPTFNRFYAKTFLTEAIRYFEGAAGRCMVDNTSVIVVAKTGKDAIIAPEMEAFGARFGFRFEAHALGHAERSGAVERPFHTIEHNFYPGRSFTDLADLNTQMRAWCDRRNATYRRSLRAAPVQLYATERTCLRPLPAYIPEVYEITHRTVDTMGLVSLHSNRYSAPEALIGRDLEVLASLSVVRLAYKSEIIAEHPRFEDGAGRTSILPGHHQRSRREKTAEPTREQRILEAAGPEFAAMIVLLQENRKGRAVRAIQRLHRLYTDYPTEPLRQTLKHALAFGLDDLARVEGLLLRSLGGELFQLPIQEDDDG